MDYKDDDRKSVQKSIQAEFRIHIEIPECTNYSAEKMLEQLPIGEKYIRSDRYDDIYEGLIIILHAIYLNKIELHDETFELIIKLSLMDPNLKELQLENTIYHPKVKARIIINNCQCILAMQGKFRRKFEILMSQNYFQNFVAHATTQCQFVLIEEYTNSNMDFLPYLMKDTVLFQHLLEEFNRFSREDPNTYYCIDFRAAFRYLVRYLSIYYQNHLEFELNDSVLLEIIGSTKKFLKYLDIDTKPLVLQFFNNLCRNKITFAAKLVQDNILRDILEFFDPYVVKNTILLNIFAIYNAVTEYKDFNDYLFSQDIDIWRFINHVLNNSSLQPAIQAQILELVCRLFLIRQDNSTIELIDNLFTSLNFQYKEQVSSVILRTIYHLPGQVFRNVYNNSDFFFFLVKVNSELDVEYAQRVAYLTLDLSRKLYTASQTYGQTRFKDFVESDEDIIEWLDNLFEQYDDIIANIEQEFAASIPANKEFIEHINNELHQE